MDSRQQLVDKLPTAERTTVLRPAVTMEPPRPDGVRDTIESIVVAFILAFVFRAFVVEAFVIPTGSMAPGLYGQHGEHRCDLCKYPIVFGIKEDSAGRIEVPQSFYVRCPNCGYAEGGNGNLNTREAPESPSSGDRILVLKWPYDIGSPWLGPKRWDVVVFKDPQEGEQNYIKRLIGLPGEVLEIVDGDIYAAPAEEVPADIREALEKPPTFGRPDARRLNPDQQKRLAKVLKIRRKTRVAQESLWMVHYDHDYKPDLAKLPVVPPFLPLWAPEGQSDSPWDTATSRIKFKPRDEGEHWLRLRGKPIQDNYGYNDMNPHQPRFPAHHVGDVRLRFVLVPGGNQGSVSLDLRKGTDGFLARLSTDGTVVLERLGQGGVRLQLQKAHIEPFRPLQPHVIEFENVDYRVALRIDDVDVVATDDSQYSPDVVGLLNASENIIPGQEAGVRIGAEGLPLEIRHLTVDRDVYYRSDFPLDEGTLRQRNPFARYPGWATCTNPIFLRSDPPDYFCLGDNSPQSMDGRLWWKVCPLLESRGDYQHGTVPGDQMIGQAFFVYWPGGYRFSKDTPAVIPNVGKMRIIR